MRHTLDNKIKLIQKCNKINYNSDNKNNKLALKIQVQKSLIITVSSQEPTKDSLVIMKIQD